MIDIEKLRSFYYVIKEGSLIKAASALDKNHTTLSKHLTDLEQSYNIKLFVRKRKRLELTEKGKELFTLAQSTIPNLENGATEILSLSATYFFAAFVFIPRAICIRATRSPADRIPPIPEAMP